MMRKRVLYIHFCSKCKIFLCLLLYVSFSHAQIYTNKDVVFTTKEGATIYTGNSTLPNQEYQKGQSEIYVVRGTVVSGFKEHSNAKLHYVEATKVSQNKKRKRTTNERNRIKKVVKDPVLPPTKSRISIANTDGSSGLILAQKVMSATAGSVSSSKKFRIAVFENYLTNFIFFSFLLKQSSDNNRKNFAFLHCNAFNTRPPPFSAVI